MSNRRKLDQRAAQRHQLHGRRSEPSRAMGGLTMAPGQVGVWLLAAGALGSAAMMGLHGGAASAVGNAAATRIPATLAADAVPLAGAGPVAGVPGNIIGALTIGSSPAGPQALAQADLATKPQLFQDLFNPRFPSDPASPSPITSQDQGAANMNTSLLNTLFLVPGGIGGILPADNAGSSAQGGQLTPQTIDQAFSALALPPSPDSVLFNAAPLAGFPLPAQALSTGPATGLGTADPALQGTRVGLENLGPMGNFQIPQTDQNSAVADGLNRSQTQVAQLVPDPNSPFIPGTDIPTNLNIQPGGFIPNGSGIITVTPPGGGTSVTIDSVGNAKVTIPGGIGPDGLPEPPTILSLQPGGSVNFGSANINISGNASSSVPLAPGTYKIGNPPPDGQPDNRPSIIVDPGPPASSPQAPPASPPGAGAGTDATRSLTDAGAGDAVSGQDQQVALNTLTPPYTPLNQLPPFNQNPPAISPDGAPPVPPVTNPPAPPAPPAPAPPAPPAPAPPAPQDGTDGGGDVAPGAANMTAGATTTTEDQAGSQDIAFLAPSDSLGGGDPA